MMSVAPLSEMEPGSVRRPKYLPLSALRSQVAIVRALADQVDRMSRLDEADGLRDQLIEELARLGCRLIEEASSMAGPARPEDSGVFERTLR
ncbi:MAG TPA: hypothetical protein VGL81_26055 [Polyangiaceae bacterium]